MTFGEKLLALRKKNGLTQEDLAERLGVSRQAVARWERGDTSPDIKNLRLICRVFSVSADFMIDHEAEEDYSDTPRPDSRGVTACVDNTQPERGSALLWLAVILFGMWAVLGIGIIIQRYSFNIAALGIVWTITSVMGMIISIRKYFKK